MKSFHLDREYLNILNVSKYRVSHRIVLNFKAVFLIFLMTYQKKTRFAIKIKIEKLSWSHLDICLNSKIEEFFYMSKIIFKSRKKIFSLLIKIKHKVFHFLSNITQLKKLELPKNFSQNYHLFRHGSSKYICVYN